MKMASGLRVPGWLEFAYRHGVWKTVSIHFLLAIAVIGGMLYILSTIYQPYGTITIRFVVSITITTSTVATLTFHQHLKKALARAPDLQEV